MAGDGKNRLCRQAEARKIAHTARSVPIAKWPPFVLPKPDFSYLSGCRALSNDLGDAAIFEHLNGDDDAAVDTLRDLLHMADLLQEPSDKGTIQLLVIMGIYAIAMDRLNAITFDMAVTRDASDARKVPIENVKDLIRQLLHHPDGRDQLNEFVKVNDLFIDQTDTPMGFTLVTAQPDHRSSRYRVVNSAMPPAGPLTLDKRPAPQHNRWIIDGGPSQVRRQLFRSIGSDHPRISK